MKFGIITDPHLGADTVVDGVVQIRGAHAARYLSKAIRTLSEIPDLAFIAQLGDGIEDCKDGVSAVDLDRLAELAKQFSGLHVPVHHLIGNHDAINLSDTEVATHLGMSGTHYSFDAGGYTGIVLFCPSVNNSFPTLQPSQLEWLADTLADAKREVLLFMHHPLADQSLDDLFWFRGKPEKAFVKNCSDVLKIISDSKKVRAGFNGHLHGSSLAYAAGIPFFTIQSISQSVGPSFEPSEAFALVNIGDDSISVEIFGNEPRTYSVER